MGKYATSYNINNKMLTLVADIMEEVGKLSDPHSNHSLITGGVKIDLPGVMPKSATVDFWSEWGKEKNQDGIVDAVKALRKQSR